MKFSVIIPLYNKAPYVSKAIGSILSQTYTDFELVIVDDGSKDDSYAVASKAIEGASNCQIYRQENAGVSMARNNGVAFSKGDYLCFLDADDWWEPAFLEEMSRLIEEFPDAGIYGTNYTIVNESHHRTRVASIGVEEDFEKGYINYCQVYAKTMYMPLTSISVAIPRLIFEEIQGFPEEIRFGEDFLLWIRIALKHKVVFLNKPLAYYNQDVELANRGLGHLHKPHQHMLWNQELLSEEKRNPDLKQLLDNLRTFSLMPYYISKDYHDDAAKELGKVDWNKQSLKTKMQYKKPIVWLRLQNAFFGMGSKCKQMLLKILRNNY